jgi:ATP-dependent protease ClpP protease subunit
MGKKIIDIDGYIGSGGYSSQYVKNALRDAKDDNVEVHINSLGGDVSHAIAIKDMLQAHGKVVAIYSGMSASSATIIGLGCKAIKMTKDSFMLIHKPMMYVDAWGALNEDELRQLIDKLDAQLEGAQKVTLQIAKMYNEKSGKPMKEILDLMKKSTWLTAEESEKWGFVDEITEPVKVTNYAEDLKLVALLAGNDLPPLPRKENKPATAVQEDMAARIEKTGENLLKKFTNLFSNHTKINTEMSKPNIYALICLALVLDELKVDDKGGIFLNKEQLDKIEAEFKKLQDAKALAETNLATANTDRDTAVNALAAANTAKDNAVSALATATTAMDELGATVKAAAEPVKKVEAIRTLLAAKPGAAPTLTKSEKDNHGDIEMKADAADDFVKTKM